MNIRSSRYTVIEKLEKLEHFKNKIKGNDFSISNRDKNRSFRQEYNLNRNKIALMILDLSDEDFKCTKLSNNKIQDCLLYIYKRKYKLINIYGEDEDVVIYIKISEFNKEKPIVIVSFHESE